MSKILDRKKGKHLKIPRSLKAVTIAALIVVSSTNAFANSVGCEHPASPELSFNRQTVVSAEVRALWAPSEFSNPHTHNPQSYRYLVHTIDINGSQFSAESSFQFIENVVGRRECATYSASLIDQDKRGTFGRIGFILEVPEANILLAKNSDMGSVSLSTNEDPKKFNDTLNWYLKVVGTLPKPEALLKLTSSQVYNEVLVEGKVARGIKIIGVFIKSGTENDPTRSKLIKQIANVAATRSLPIVVIENAN